MKVLHFYRTYFPDTQGGLEEAIRQICLGTQAFGVQSRVLTLSPDPAPAVLRLPEAAVVRTQLNLDIASCSMSMGSFAAFRKLAARADVLHFHFPWPFADLVRLLMRPAKPSLITYHSDIVRQKWLGRLYAPLMHSFLQQAGKIVATSPNYFASSTILRSYAEKVEVVPIGISEASYPQVSEEELSATQANYGKDFFLFVGVLRHYKGLHVLLEAIQGAPYQVIIVGEGPEASELKRQAERLRLSNVRFAGYLPDKTKLALLKLCRGLVFPSHLRSEAFGVSLLEGSMVGKPLISTEIATGTSFINIDNETGLVVPPADAQSLRRVMDRLHADQVLAARLGSNARARFEQYFTAAHMGSAYAELYNDVAANFTAGKNRETLLESA